MALRSDGTVLVWGYEGLGLRGDGIDRGGSSLPVPTRVTPVSGVTRIALSGFTVLVLAPAMIMPHVVGELRASALSIVLLGLGALVSWTTNVAEIGPALATLGRPFKLFLINAGYWLVGLLVIGGILARWR